MNLDNQVFKMKALANPKRIKILKYLIESGQEKTVGVITEYIGGSIPAISRHLAILKSAGFLKGERLGINSFYQIRESQVKYLNQVIAA